IALSADSLAARGPAVILLGGKTAGTPQPDGWPPRTMRGFGFFTFDQQTAAGTERLAAEARATGLPPNHPLLDQPFVLRLNLHRTPPTSGTSRCAMRRRLPCRRSRPRGSDRVASGHVGQSSA